MQQKAEQHSLKLPPIVEQYYEFCVWLLPKVSKFKKDQKYILGTRLQNSALESLELILSAALSSKKEKLPFAVAIGIIMLFTSAPPTATTQPSLTVIATVIMAVVAAVRRLSRGYQ